MHRSFIAYQALALAHMFELSAIKIFDSPSILVTGSCEASFIDLIKQWHGLLTWRLQSYFS
jgi:hypothetical protein